MKAVKNNVADSICNWQSVAGSAQLSRHHFVDIHEPFVSEVVFPKRHVPHHEPIVVAREHKTLPIRPQASRAPHLGAELLQRIPGVNVDDDDVRQIVVVSLLQPNDGFPLTRVDANAGSRRRKLTPTERLS